MLQSYGQGKRHLPGAKEVGVIGQTTKALQWPDMQIASSQSGDSHCYPLLHVFEDVLAGTGLALWVPLGHLLSQRMHPKHR